jgi:hypothetical protein
LSEVGHTEGLHKRAGKLNCSTKRGKV